MRNVSINNEDIQLKEGNTYIIIDALYLDEIKNNYNESFNAWDLVRKKVFPYTDTPFAEYVPQDTFFTVVKIIKLNYDEVFESDTSVFSTDTGLILIINENILWDFIRDYNYEELVNSEIELLNFSYWNEITAKYDYKDIGILTSFQESENDFDGSGTYKIVN